MSLLLLIFSFLSLVVCENGTCSSSVTLKAGTPQGSCLSPILYLIFVNDLTVNVNQEETSASQYADDVNLYCTHRNLETATRNVQKALYSVEKWCQKWQVIINANKSQVVIFTKCPTHKQVAADLKIFNQAIPTSSEASYLGVTFDCRLTWERQITKMCERAYGRLNLLRAMASLSSKHNPNVLSLLFNSTIRSIFEYPSVCILSAANMHIEKLQLIQNEAMRIILRVPSYIPIAKLNDAACQSYVKDHLSKIADQRIRYLQSNSSLVRKTIANFKSICRNNYNSSPLDVLNY